MQSACPGKKPTDLPGARRYRVAGSVTIMREHPKDPLHGITLEAVLREMVERYGWDELAARIPVRCFMFDPSIKSSLTFLRKTPWARKRLEDWFVAVK